MSDEIKRRDGTRFVTTLRPGETWFYAEGTGAIVICHPMRPPVVIGDPAIRGTLDAGNPLTYEFVGEDGPRSIYVRRDTALAD
jgi:hypothetical protein